MKESYRRLALAGCSALGLLVAGTAGAVPLAPGVWSPFFFAEKGSSWDRTFKFLVTGVAELKVTDAFLSGDRFSVYDTGSFLIDTTVPTTEGDSIGADWDTAFTSPQWSSGVYLFGPGTYQVSGFAIESPFDAGQAALRVDALSGTVSPVPGPLPAMLLLSGLGAIMVLRRKPASSV